MAAVYAIDGSNVNDREDWRTGYLPGPLAAEREESFPGDPNQYAALGVAMPPIFTVTGFIWATSHTNLYNSLRTYDLMRQDISGLHSITFYGLTVTGCRLKALQILGSPEAEKEGSTTYVRIPVRFVWQKMTAL
ncbi:MAG: hypothetical protein IT445_03070 [Phycisphaeraceae bacterium]|nr:hypothetical protein [Phycisphaeraceae bacterium]